jgi:hypothetical protein
MLSRNPDKRDKCVNEIMFCQKTQKIISNLTKVKEQATDQGKKED